MLKGSSKRNHRFQSSNRESPIKYISYQLQEARSIDRARTTLFFQYRHTKSRGDQFLNSHAADSSDMLTGPTPVGHLATHTHIADDSDDGTSPPKGGQGGQNTTEADGSHSAMKSHLRHKAAWEYRVCIEQKKHAGKFSSNFSEKILGKNKDLSITIESCLILYPKIKHVPQH